MYINGHNLCIGCMRSLDSGSDCSFCGLKQEEYTPIPRCLKPGTELADRYVTGKVLGEGSFGITYMGWDKDLDIPVAVKEYFPSDMVSRDVICGSDNSVYLYENEKKNAYKDYLKKFWEEARCLSRFNQVEGVVSVLDFFYENNTAYIVMQYIDGISVKEYVSQNGKIPADKVLETIGPVLLALEQVHNMGIVHRDISPDNLMMKKDGSLVLIDFGAARMRNVDNTKTMTVMFKRGFSPEEQYRCKGRWGAYTDVYSICATIYFMMTGKTPMDSVIRALGDDMPSLVSMKELNVPVKQRKAIMKGLAVSAKDRCQNIGELYQALFEENVEYATCRIGYKKVMVGVSLAVVIVGTAIGGGHPLRDAVEADNERFPAQVEQTLSETGEATAQEGLPSPVVQEEIYWDMIGVQGLDQASAEMKLKEYGNRIKITWKYKYSGKVKKGKIISQSISKGEKIKGEDVSLILVVSRGQKKVSVPKLTGLRSAVAEQKLEERGLKCKIKQVEHDEEEGTVTEQSIGMGKKVPEDTVVTIMVSKGRTTTPRPKASSTKAPSWGTDTRKKTGTSKKEGKQGDFAGIIQ